MKTAEAKPRYIVVGGFLGAGKTSAIIRLGEILKGRGHRIGVITNDEGTELVDSAQLRLAGFDVEEVNGGPFAGQLPLFFEAADRLKSRGASILFSECTGTSADLHSALIKPVLEKFGSEIIVAPLSVLVDAVRAARFLRLDSGATFSEQLSYIYRKQIEEAEILVINKTDLVPAALLNNLRKSLSEISPNANICTVSVRNNSGLDEWIDCLTTREHSPATASIDRDVFRNAEALLGWLNCTVKVSSVKYFNAEKLLTDLATAIQSILKHDAIEVAHLKLVLRANNDFTAAVESAAISLVRNDLAPELTGEIADPVQRAELILNLRAEARPDLLHTVVNRAVLEIMERAPELFARMAHCEHFQPARRN